MPLGSQVKKYRNAAGCTYADVEAMSGVSTGNINAIEKRNSGRSEHAPALARAFGLSTDELLDEANDHTDRVIAWITQWRVARAHPSANPAAREPVPNWAPTAWPFSVSRERIHASLGPDDLRLIDTYILALVHSREAEQGKYSPR